MSALERTLLRRFFRSVSLALAKRMTDDYVPREELLTSLLGEMLNDNHTARHVLDYSAAQLNEDLKRCGSPNGLSVHLETVEHNPTYEGKVSFADLGLRVETQTSGNYRVRYAVLQAKKLDPKGSHYSLGTRYESFKNDQFKSLLDLAKRTSASGVYYLFYNPCLDAFKGPETERIREFDASRDLQHPDVRRRTHVLMREFGLDPDEYWGWLGGAVLRDNVEDAAKLLAEFPGPRVSGISTVRSLKHGRRMASASYRPSLLECYEHAGRTPAREFDDDCNFMPLFLYLADGLMFGNGGTDNRELAEVACGAHDPTTPPSDSDTPPPNIGVRHVLTIRYRRREGGDEVRHH